MKRRAGWHPARFVALIAAGAFLACSVGLEETREGIALATITTFEVADSSRADSITVRLAGFIGQSTAYSFDRIDTLRTDTLISVTVWGKWKESSKEVYAPTPPSFDTTVVLHSPRFGLHYIDVYSSSAILRDSTFVY